MTDDEALQIATSLLEREVATPGPTWLQVIDLCLWVKEAHKRIPKPKRPRKEYMRDYMRTYMRKHRAKQGIDGTHS
jgi:hypothetical protein